MSRVLLSILFGLFVYFLANLSPMVVNSFSEKALTSHEDKVFEPGAEKVMEEEGAKNAEGEGKEKKGNVRLKGFLYKSSDNKYYISSRQRMWIEAEDIAQGAKGVGVQKIEVKLDGEEKYYEYIGPKTKSFSIGTEGEHPIVYRVTDKLNNTTEPKTFQVIVDNSPPISEIEYLVKSPWSYYIKAHVVYIPVDHKISVFGSDAGAGIKEIKVSENNSSYQVYKAGDTFTLTKTGLNIVKVRAIDNVLNESNDAIYNLYVDKNPPLIAVSPKYLLLPSEDDGDSASDTDDKDKDKGTEPKKDIKKEDKGGADKDTPLEEVRNRTGENRILPGAEEEDEEGEEEDEEGEEEKDGEEDAADEEGWAKGKKPKGRYTNTSNVFYLRAYDSESGVSHIEYRIDDKGEWVVYKEPFKIEVPGKHILYIRATDYVGNKRVVQLPLIVDHLAPKSDIEAENRKEAVITSGGGKVGKGIDESGKADEIVPRNEE